MKIIFPVFKYKFSMKFDGSDGEAKEGEADGELR